MWGWEVRNFLYGTWRSSCVPFPAMQSLRKIYHFEGKAFSVRKIKYISFARPNTVPGFWWLQFPRSIYDLDFSYIKYRIKYLIFPCILIAAKEAMTFSLEIELTIFNHFLIMLIFLQKAWFQPPKCKTASWPITAVAHMSMLLSIMFNFFELLSHSKYNRVAFQYCLYRASIHNYASRPNKPCVIYYLSCA